MRLNPYAAIVFDLDDTLIAEESVSRRSLVQAAQLVAGQDPEQVADVARATARRIWREAPDHAVALEQGISSWEALWSGFGGGHPMLDGLRTWSRAYASRVWRESLAHFGVEDDNLADRLVAEYRRAQRGADRTFPGVSELLVPLRARGVRLGLLTNGPPDIQRHKLAYAGLADIFNAVAISGEVGVGKRDRMAFEHVQRALGVEGPLLMVGDSWDRPRARGGVWKSPPKSSGIPSRTQGGGGSLPFLGNPGYGPERRACYRDVMRDQRDDFAVLLTAIARTSWSWRR